MATSKKKGVSSTSEHGGKPYFKNNFKGQIFPGKQLIMNVFGTLCEENPKESLNHIAKKTAEMTGVSVHSVWRAKREYTECGGKFPAPIVKRPNAVGKKTRIKKYDESSLSAIKRKVSEFLAKNEIPTRSKLMEAVNLDSGCPHFASLRTFERLIKDMGFDSKYKLHKPKAPTPNPANSTPTVIMAPRKTNTPFVSKPSKPKITIDDTYEVKLTPSEHFVHCEVVYREDFLVLYARNIKVGKTHYEMVVHKDIWQSAHPCATYSLFRTVDKPEAIGLFLLLKQVLPIFLACTPELITRDNLQELCNVTRKKPNWTAAHIAAHLGWIDCFKHEVIAKQINDVCPETLVSPLHVAVECQMLTLIQFLVNLDARIDFCDKKGDTIYHYAAVTNPDIIRALVSWETPPIINKRNAVGHTPLYLACLANNPECVRELLRSGADITITGVSGDTPLQAAIEASNALCAKEIMDMYPNQLYDKKQSPPLHWAKTTECLEALIDFGCLLDAKNYEGNSALHVMVARNRLSCVLCLLSHGANPDLPGSDEGGTALHLAVKMGDPSIVHALVVFEANPNLANVEGVTPRHLVASGNYPNKDYILYILHSVGAKRCPNMFPGCTRGCASGADLNGIVPEKISQLGMPKLYDGLLGLAAVASALSKKETLSMNHHGHSCRVLCLDGGGIRVLVLIQVLSALEATLGVPVMKHFDWVAGTGTGGLLALNLLIGKSIRECRGIFFRLKDKLFTNIQPPYDQEALDYFLRKTFGESIAMSDIKFGKVMLNGILSDRQPAELHLFRNYIAPARLLDIRNVPSGMDCSAHLVWQVARAACNGTLQTPEKYQQAALISTNPTLDCLTEIHERNLALKATNQDDKTEAIDIIVSLGTGLLPNNAGQPLLDKVTQAESRVVERAQAWCHMISVPHFRLNPPLTECVAPEETDNHVLVRILWETTVYLNSRKNELLELAMLLKQ